MHSKQKKENTKKGIKNRHETRVLKAGYIKSENKKN